MCTSEQSRGYHAKPNKSGREKDIICVKYNV